MSSFCDKCTFSALFCLYQTAQYRAIRALNHKSGQITKIRALSGRFSPNARISGQARINPGDLVALPISYREEEWQTGGYTDGTAIPYKENHQGQTRSALYTLYKKNTSNKKDLRSLLVEVLRNWIVCNPALAIPGIMSILDYQFYSKNAYLQNLFSWDFHDTCWFLFWKIPVLWDIVHYLKEHYVAAESSKLQYIFHRLLFGNSTLERQNEIREPWIKYFHHKCYWWWFILRKAFTFFIHHALS